MEQDYRRAAVAWIVVRFVSLGLKWDFDRCLSLASFLCREHHLSPGDLGTLPGRLPLTSAAAAEADRAGKFVDEYVYRLARILNRYEQLAAARAACQPKTSIG